MRQGTLEMKTPAIALEPRYHTQLLQVVNRCMAGTHGVVQLFGSRARGNPRPSSDIDLAVSVDANAGGVLSRLRENLEESTIPFCADVVDLGTCGSALAKEIRREGVTLWKN